MVADLSPTPHSRATNPKGRSAWRGGAYQRHFSSGVRVIRHGVRRLSRLIAVPGDVVKHLVDVIDSGRPYRLDIPKADSPGQWK
jgi:hypothetical protein